MRLIASAPIAFLLVLSLAGHAQINDCSQAVVVCDNTDLAFNPNGPGHDDYADPDNEPGCITALEQNSAWYYFQIDPTAPPGLTLGFVIHPNGGLGEDYDWALYGPNATCGDLGFPIRCSSSSAQCGFCPETGMGMGTTDLSEGPGTGDGFVMTLQVQPGQGFYLMIDNWLGTMDGFILNWTESAAEYLNCNAVPPCALNAIAGTDINACEGDQNISLNGESIGNNGNETYSWTATNGGIAFLSDPDIADPTIDLPAGFNGIITYTLRVEEDTCFGEDQIDLIVHPLPVINIPQIGPFCTNDATFPLAASPGGGTWSGDNNGNAFNPTLQGPGIHIVTYTYTNLNDCTNAESMEIEVYDIPDVSISPDPAEFCDSEGSVLLTATGSGGAGGYTYMWSTPEGLGQDPTFDAPITGVYSVTVTDANGCTFSTAITVTSHANPEVEIVDPGPICETLELFTLNANPPGGEYFGTYVDPSGELYPNTIPPGTYQVSYTYIDNNDCEDTDFANFTVIPTPSSIADNLGPFCAGQPIILIGDTDDTGIQIEYQWTGPNGFTSNIQNPLNAVDGGTYILTVVVDGCPSLPATTIVTLTSTPDAVALNGGPYCNGEQIQLLGSTSATGNVSYAWSGPNGYTSDIQNPADATVAGIYSLVVSSGTCSSTMSQTQVVFSTAPDAMATNTGPYCTGEAVNLFGNTTFTGNIISYIWTGPNGYQSSSQNPTDVVSSGSYQLIVDVDGCQSSPSNTSVTINALPQPVITGQSTFCTGFSATIDAGSGYTTYLWNNGSPSQILTVTATGNYIVTVTDANTCTAIASFDVTENASLTPVISGSLEFCEGSSTTLDAGSGYVSYLWSSGETSQTISVVDEGNIGVIVTDADGCSGSTNVTAIEHLNPIVTIGGSSTYCIGGYTTLDAGNGYISYDWSTDSTTQTIVVTTPGFYTVDIIDSYGCAGSGSVNVTESTSLTPIITGTPAFCENGNTTLNAGSGFATYVWSDGSMNQTLNVNSTGIYEVSVSDGQGCFGSSAVAVTEVLPPSAVVQTSASLCNTTAGGSIIDLFSLINSGDVNGNWQDVDNSGAVGLFDNLNFNNIPAGDYNFIYTTNSATDPCPEASYDVVITILECTCPDVFFINPEPLCNSSATLDLESLQNTNENGIWSLIQSPAGTNPATLNGSIFNAANGDPGDYVFEFALTTQPPPGCPLDFQVTVQVDAKVFAGLFIADLEFCHLENRVVDLTDMIVSEDPNGTWTEWSSTPSQGGAFNAANGTFNIVNQTPHLYLFLYTVNSNGVCPDDSVSASVWINPLPVATIEDGTVLDCAAPIQSLDATGSSSGTEYDIEWAGPGIVVDGNENTLQPSIDQAGMYQLTITNLYTGCVQTASIDITAQTDPPTGALINAQDPSCFGQQDAMININQVSGGTPPYQYSLNNQPFVTGISFQQLPAGQYALVIEDVNG
ncbi:MAG: SprB repeat-containing protein, partial [Bacteroidota bacterium]|nr:SprB repeat-containing protein [Bacteroidota bacterium]